MIGSPRSTEDETALLNWAFQETELRMLRRLETDGERAAEIRAAIKILREVYGVAGREEPAAEGAATYEKIKPMGGPPAQARDREGSAGVG